MNNVGKIIYLIGPSGSGKDAILSALRQRLDASQTRPSIMIAHRYICRDWLAGNENHIQLSDTEFQRRQQLDLFALHWQANNLHYGIGREIDLWLTQGQTVVMNGSRGYLPTAMTLYGEQLVPVLITVDESILRQRLITRGRESLNNIEARITRTKQEFVATKAPLSNYHCIDNSTQINGAVEKLMTYISNVLDDT